VKILVAIANHGTGNRSYLDRLLAEYRSFQFEVHVVILSDIPKDLGPDVEVLVGRPTRNPWSLPFAHKQLFRDRLDEYDYFIYSEDDTLVTERNFRAYLEVSQALPEDEVAGFLRYEEGPDGARYLSGIHSYFRWDASSVRFRGGNAFAFFTNEHAAMFLLSRAQLRRAIASGGFLAGPREGRYDMLCTAATDPYTGCGMRKMICVSRLDDFLIAHLPNKYIGKLGLPRDEVQLQIDALLRIGKGELQLRGPIGGAVSPEGPPPVKNLYEPPRDDLLALVPAGAKRVLSVGCGWGALEGELLRRGVSVTGIPFDPIIAASAAHRGVDVRYDSIDQLRAGSAERFDCILFVNVLHLFTDPAQALKDSTSLLREGGAIVASLPYASPFRRVARWLRSRFRFRLGTRIDDVQPPSPRTVRSWFRKAELGVEQPEMVMPPARRRSGLPRGLRAHAFAYEVILLARSMPKNVVERPLQARAGRLSPSYSTGPAADNS
jgi:2-polyprenyl-3-methyl-5-hydroxy-6-metoxy-1,4-benzoquinol methylase